jgi:predicted TIM-barrel enzyme
MTAKPVFPPKPNAVQALFGRRQVVIGVIHSRPLPGSPQYDGEAMEDLVGFALAEAERYRAGGVDGLIVENHGDIPFAKPERLGPETAACMG